MTKRDLLNEVLTQTDKSEIERIARKEIKDFFDSNPTKNKIKDIINDEIKSVTFENKIKKINSSSYKDKEFEDKIVGVTRNVLVQLYKQFYMRRGFWTGSLSNDAN